MKKHPEDSHDWSEYVNKRDEWGVPDSQRDEFPADNSQPQAGTPGTDGAVGPYGATESPWQDFDDRDPQPPRESTPYEETSPWTNHAAWRYQQNPYRGDPEEYRKGCSGVLWGGIGLGIALIVIALILL